VATGGAALIAVGGGAALGANAILSYTEDDTL